MAEKKERYYIQSRLSDKISFTPEGFLLCEKVPVARTGMMIYGEGEIPIEPGPDGHIKISRDDKALFAESVFASIKGKPVTDEHPDDDVSPENWKELAIGTVMNPRRGEGAEDDLLFVDMLITRKDGIDLIMKEGKREISMGYDAEYVQTGDGTGEQTEIIVNHFALVEQGRCGPRCAIKDRKPEQSKGDTMKNLRTIVRDAVHQAFKAKDADEANRIAEEAGTKVADAAEETSGTHIHIHGGQGSTTDEDGEKPAFLQKKEGETCDDDLQEGANKVKFTDEDISAEFEQNKKEHAAFAAAIAALEKRVAELTGGTQDEGEGKGGESATNKATLDEDEDKDEDGRMTEDALQDVPEDLREEAKKTHDSAAFSDSFRDTVAMAEILVPGIRIPTFDSAAKPGATFKAICGLRRTAIELAYNQPETRAIIDDITGGKRLDTASMTCDSIRNVFRSAASARRAVNNGTGVVSGFSKQPVARGPMTLAEVNRRNAELYGQS